MHSLSFWEREQLFHALAQLSRSGIALGKALEVLSRSADRRVQSCLNFLMASLPISENLGEAFRRAGFSKSDAAIVQAGEASGRLDAVFLELAQFYAQLAQARRTVITKSIYPVIVLHLAAILLAIPPAILDGGWPVFLARSLPIVLGFYFSVWLGAVLWQIARSSLSRSPVAAKTIIRIPVLGRFLLNWTLWKFTSVLSLYITAGGSLLRALETAGTVCENASLRASTTAALSRIKRGERLSEAFRKQSDVSEPLLRSLEIGEHAGRLDEESRRAAEFFKNQTLQDLDAFAQWSPRLLYVSVVLFTAWRIITTASTFGAQIGSALHM
jgi:type II secretory pathway component PulF